MGKPIEQAFYLKSDALQVSRELLGKVLVTQMPGAPVTAGKIVETEAYIAPEDKASHAYNFKKTKRTQTMFLEGGVAYVYLCYGIHALFNIITNVEGMPHAVLVRSVEPLEGQEIMLARRNKAKIERTLTAGPGCLTQALGITTHHDQHPLFQEPIWLEDRGYDYDESNIVSSERVGIAYAGEYVYKPWRFRVKDSKWTSKPHS